jgi:hypothetical protein
MEKENILQEEEQITDVAIIEQPKETVAILQQLDLKEVKEAMEKVSKFKRSYTPKKLAVTDIDSKEQNKKLIAAIADVRTTRTSLEKVRKEKIKPYKETIEYINGNYNKAIEILEAIQDPLEKIKDDVKEKIEARDKEAELKQAALLNERVDKLMKAGIVFHPDSKYYVIGSEEFDVPVTSFDAADIQSMTDKIFEGQLAIVTEKSETITRLTAEKKQKDADAEKKRLEDEAEQKRKDDELRLENEKKQKELDAEKEQMRKDRIELRGEALENIGFTHDKSNKHFSFGSNKISEGDIAEFDKAKWDALFNEYKAGITKYRTVKARVAELEALGMALYDTKREYAFNGIAVSFDLIETADAGAWEDTIHDAKEKIELKKAELTRLEKAKEAKDKLRSERIAIIAPYASYGEQIKGDVADLSDTEFSAVLEEKKAAYDKKISDDAQVKIDADKKKKADELAAASDSTKWAAFIEHLKNAPVLEMESDEYKAKYQNALDILTAIK